MADFTVQLWSNPMAVLQASQAAASEWMELWGAAARRAAGQAVEPVIAPERGDRRFGDPAWSEDPVFDYLKQAYLLASRQATDLVDEAEGIDEATRTRAQFFTQAYLNALSPANFAFTNPEAIRRAIDTGSISLLSGLANLLADAATDAKLPVRRASAEFELGKDIAATPGSVVFQNELMQLIQYAPATETVHKRPLLYVPPLVNKYYLLDLQPKSSPDPLAGRAGPHVCSSSPGSIPGPSSPTRASTIISTSAPLAALDAIEKATGETRGRPVRLLHGRHARRHGRGALAAPRRGRRIASLTTIGSMFDFANMGQWATFTEPAQLEAMEQPSRGQGRDRRARAAGACSAWSAPTI